MRHLVICFMVLFSPLCLAETNATVRNCDAESAAKLVSLQGTLFFDADGSGRWQPGQLDQTFCEGSRVRVEAYSRASLLLPNGITLRLGEGTILSLNGIATTQPTLLDLLKGFVHFISRTPRQLQITTPIANAGPEGTEFALRADAATADLWVYEGAVRFFNADGDIHMKPGEAAHAVPGQAPRARIDIRPGDAVNWALYYPPLLPYPDATTPIDPALRAVIQDYRQGRVDAALAALDAFPPAQQTSYFFKVRGAIRLTAGQSELAMRDIQALWAQNPDDADALALASVLALTQGHKPEAHALALQAVNANPQSANAHSALSYVWQGHFELEKALQSAERAKQLAPHDAITWARLSELQLALGLRSESAESASKAFALDPGLERTQTVMGFSNLFRVDTAGARQHFDTAIRLDSKAPLPRLGLGLAKIRSGDLEAGRRDLEIAAILDPNNSLIRSYLGKAYFEEKRERLAGDQFDLAKQRDPKDPTPYFYDALRKQAANRPIEALQDMQQARDLNDNRGVYRSEQLLDEDAAARSANLARIYNDLGFGRVALKEAWTSLGQDAANPSAHRFLSDSYIGQPRYRVARASELLQAQLLQPINITPVQPQLTGENIGILNNTGPGSLSMNEYDSLYTANGAHLVLNGAYGSRDTKTDSAIVSGIYNNLSMSLGQFHYQTDGFRQNDDYQRNVYDAFAQYAFTQDFNLQVELKSENVRAGDVPMRLNEFHDETLRQTIKQDTARIGSHFKIDPEQDVIGSFFYTRRKELTHDNFLHAFADDPDFDNLDDTSRLNKNEGYQTEIQYLYRPHSFELITGVGHLELRNDINYDNTNVFINGAPDPLTDTSKTTSQTHHFNGYIYSKQYLPGNLTTTLGLSFDYLDNELVSFDSARYFSDGSSRISTRNPSLIKRQQLNPKFGIAWNPIENLTLRGAIFKTLNRRLAANQTIEPTQIAGFNQFFDDNNNARAWRYGVGLDYHPLKTVFMGGELSWRDSRQPFFFDNGSSVLLDRNELSHLAYFYWAPTEWVAFRTEYKFEKLDRSFVLGNGSSNLPQSVGTHQVPLSINLFHPSGLFTRVSGTYVNQHVATVSDFIANPLDHQSEDFWTFDTAIGYRFPKKLGTINFEVRNLFDNKFNYQSNFDASGPQIGPFIPERQLFVKISFFY
ncbi:TonB-dependent receptor [Methylomonas montana]|uniref:FecR domain-containing protein n=1 Tax=Methylomonas montana TaxID=3058963 RepID=UPI00265948BC|nr:FecR domain-containing protein [Methylomonas montana]WKJ88866.1 TonB-dependent receptor [Methylomonas montana]